MFDRLFRKKRAAIIPTSASPDGSGERGPLRSAVSFGDRVRIASSSETDKSGFAGKVGSVFGETTPSVSGVSVIGVLKRDYAANVYFDDLGEGFWFTEELIEFLDHGAGGEIRLDGVDKRWVRDEDGQWVELDIG